MPLAHASHRPGVSEHTAAGNDDAEADSTFVVSW